MSDPGDDVMAEQVSVETPGTVEVRARRIPNFGHALLFVSFTGLLLVVLQVVLALLGESPAAVRGGVITLQHPKLQIATLAATYLASLAAAWLFYPAVWRRGFLDGIEWNWAVARRQAGKLMALGFLLGMMVQAITYFITPAKTLPIDEFFATPLDAWLITVFGTIVAPVFEEICFRGFLVPGFAIAYDWLRLPRTEEARARWQSTTAVTPAALVFSAVLTSVCFAMLHAEQVAHIRAALAVLFAVSLVLTYVRVKMGSVAASAMVHGAYNFLVFLMVMIATGGYRHLERMTR
jgi:membrane protease YdiL (CAAX protease family)